MARKGMKPNLGKTHSEETKKRLSILNKGNKNSKGISFPAEKSNLFPADRSKVER